MFNARGGLPGNASRASAFNVAIIGRGSITGNLTLLHVMLSITGTIVRRFWHILSIMKDAFLSRLKI